MTDENVARRERPERTGGWPILPHQSRFCICAKTIDRESFFLAAVFLSSALLCALIAVTSKVLTGNTTTYDWAIVLALREPADLVDPIGPNSFELMAKDIDALGRAPVSTLIAFAAVVYFFVAHKRGDALCLVVAVGGATLLNSGLKVLIARPGLDLALGSINTSAFSFPSGHAAISAATYLTIGALLARAVPEPRMKNYILSIAIAPPLLVGASRIYLGVHYPTDILAGWALGAAWALLCTSCAFRRRI